MKKLRPRNLDNLPILPLLNKWLSQDSNLHLLSRLSWCLLCQLSLTEDDPSPGSSQGLLCDSRAIPCSVSVFSVLLASEMKARKEDEGRRNPPHLPKPEAKGRVWIWRNAILRNENKFKMRKWGGTKQTRKTSTHIRTARRGDSKYEELRPYAFC